MGPYPNGYYYGGLDFVEYGYDPGYPDGYKIPDKLYMLLGYLRDGDPLTKGKLDPDPNNPGRLVLTARDPTDSLFPRRLPAVLIDPLPRPAVMAMAGIMTPTKTTMPVSRSERDRHPGRTPSGRNDRFQLDRGRVEPGGSGPIGHLWRDQSPHLFDFGQDRRFQRKSGFRGEALFRTRRILARLVKPLRTEAENSRQLSPLENMS